MPQAPEQQVPLGLVPQPPALQQLLQGVPHPPVLQHPPKAPVPAMQLPPCDPWVAQVDPSAACPLLRLTSFGGS
jgi:hypothetical protein